MKKHPKLVGHDGWCDHENNIIYIQSDLTEDGKKTTLLHEIIHIVERNNSIKLTERDVMCLESGLFQIIHDNKLRF